MEQQVLQYIGYGVTLALGGLALWYKGNAKLSGKVTALIAEAEEHYKDTVKSGGQKFEWVVDQLYALIPAGVRPFVPKAVVGALVQTTFDAIEGYAIMQLKKLTKAEA